MYCKSGKLDFSCVYDIFLIHLDYYNYSGVLFSQYNRLAKLCEMKTLANSTRFIVVRNDLTPKQYLNNAPSPLSRM